MYAAGSVPGGRVRPVIDNEAHYENRYNNGNGSKASWNASDVRIGSWQAVSFISTKGNLMGVIMVNYRSRTDRRN